MPEDSAAKSINSISKIFLIHSHKIFLHVQHLPFIFIRNIVLVCVQNILLIFVLKYLFYICQTKSCYRILQPNRLLLIFVTKLLFRFEWNKIMFVISIVGDYHVFDLHCWDRQKLSQFGQITIKDWPLTIWLLMFQY